MNLEKFLEIKLIKEQLEFLDYDSNIEEIEKHNENIGKLAIMLVNEIINMINTGSKGKKIVSDNVVKFMRI